MKNVKNQEAEIVGGFNPSEKKYSSQIGSFSQVGVKIKNVWNHLGHVSGSVL